MLPAPAPTLCFLGPEYPDDFLDTHIHALHPRLRFCILCGIPSASEASLPHVAGVQDFLALRCCLGAQLISVALAGVRFECGVRAAGQICRSL